MTLSERARSVWAKFGYNPESDQWLPLWLHLLDSSAVAEHLAERWLAPTAGDLIEREFAGSTSGLTPTEEFCLLASWITGVQDIGKCTPAFSCQERVQRTRASARQRGMGRRPARAPQPRHHSHGRRTPAALLGAAPLVSALPRGAVGPGHRGGLDRLYGEVLRAPLP